MQKIVGDIRLSERGERIFSDIVLSGNLVVKKFSKDRAAELAAHRFLASDSVTPEKLLESFAVKTNQICTGRHIVVAQDTTEINFSGRDRSRKGLGRAGDGISLGFFIHPIVAIDARDEAVLGVAGAQIWARGMEKVGDRRKRRAQDRESARWLESCHMAATALPDAAHVTVVGDRESDIYALYAQKPEQVDLVVRARSDRKLADGRSMYAAADSFMPCREMDVKVASRGVGDPGRMARVQVSFGRVEIARSQSAGVKGNVKTIALHLIMVREIVVGGSGANSTVEPLLWRLLTTLPIATADDACEAIRLYRLRWRIEEVFRVLKRDGLALEKSQIEHAPRLFNLAALALGAACRIIQLTDARDTSPRPVTDVLDEQDHAAAQAISASLEGKTQRQKNPHKPTSLSWLSWIVARLGGWNCYYKPPGPKTMADGWRRFAILLEGFKLAKNEALV